MFFLVLVNISFPGQCQTPLSLWTSRFITHPETCDPVLLQLKSAGEFFLAPSFITKVPVACQRLIGEVGSKGDTINTKLWSDPHFFPIVLCTRWSEKGLYFGTQVPTGTFLTFLVYSFFRVLISVLRLNYYNIWASGRVRYMYVLPINSRYIHKRLPALLGTPKYPQYPQTQNP